MKRFILKVVLASALGLTATASQAMIIFNIERGADTAIRITGTGTLSGPAPASNAHILYLDNLFDSLLTGIVNQSPGRGSDMLIGGKGIAFGHTISTGFNWDGASSGIYFGTNNGTFSVGDSVNPGFLDFNISGIATSPIFAAPGSSGDVYWGVQSQRVVGTWRIAGGSVPEPGTVLAVGLGLAGLGFSRLRKRLGA